MSLVPPHYIHPVYLKPFAKVIPETLKGLPLTEQHLDALIKIQINLYAKGLKVDLDSPVNHLYS